MTLRRSLLALLVAAAVVAPSASAQDPPPEEPPRIAEGVTVSGVAVAGMTAEEARAALRAFFARRVPFRFKTRRWTVSPGYLGAQPDIVGAVGRALAAAPGAALTLVVSVDRTRVASYVAYLDRAYSRRVRNSVLSLRDLRPYLTRARPGIDVRRLVMRASIARALWRNTRDVLPLRVRYIWPTVTRGNYGPVVVVRRGSRRLHLYSGMRFVRRFAIAVGMPRYPTPLGRFRIVVKERNPTWNPPDSDWAAGASPIPPGPNNPLGTRWMGLSAPGIGIHGTPQPWTIGTAASHGCIRMYISQSEWLFERVRVGTTVYIVRP
jgi:lipoprotein-anchoring transpeptidase ErfK/SrfK